SRIYRRLCTQCHGLAGDGRGPGGPWLNPLPRDFRQGAFKASTAASGTGKPRVDDLRRALRGGVPGTAMQSFDSLPGKDLDAVVGYVVHLSFRGEAEFRAVKAALGEDGEPADVAAEVGRIAKQWDAAQTAAVVPAAAVPADSPDAESVRRGEKLFAAVGCAACHVDYGRAEQFRYDVWGLPNRVADLTAGKYRWGGSPEEVARRVRVGIPAANMPANPGLSDADVRDLAGFVLSLPSPPRLPEDVRGRVYAK
ncbi:MAG: cytochrome c, partial [Fimbriiglobus sp.]